MGRCYPFEEKRGHVCDHWLTRRRNGIQTCSKQGETKSTLAYPQKPRPKKEPNGYESDSRERPSVGLRMTFPEFDRPIIDHQPRPGRTGECRRATEIRTRRNSYPISPRRGGRLSSDLGKVTTREGRGPGDFLKDLNR
jgi:hypothetical protein